MAWRPMRVIFPGGIELGATGFTSEVGPTPPTWGLYLYERWQPLWPYRYVAWPDFGLPDDEADADEAILEAFMRAEPVRRSKSVVAAEWAAPVRCCRV